MTIVESGLAPPVPEPGQVVEVRGSTWAVNRFLDRRFLLSLPSPTGNDVPGFFGNIDAV